MELYPHQLQAVEKLKHQKRFLLGDSCGLGKSAVALRVAVEKGCKKVLILGPKSSILSWRDQARLWTPGYFRISTPTKTYDVTNPNLLCVYNWDSLIVKRRIDFLLGIKWDLIIADESHRGIKNWSALRCKNFIFYLAPRAENILLMTGTPITKSASDLHPTLSLLLPGEIGKFSVFCEKYCNKNFHGFGRRGFDYVGFKNENELHNILNSVMLRRTLEDSGITLPPVLYKNVPLTVEPDVVSQCLEISPDLIRSCIARGEQPPGHIMSVMRSVGMGKVAEAADYILNLPSPVVVFATHIDVISELKELLLKAKLTVGVINGGVGEKERGKIVEDFQAGEMDVFIGNYAAAAEAITLTRSCNLVTLEYPWSPATLEQAVHRCRRISQTETLQVHNLVAEGSLDSVVLDSLRVKDLGIRKVINGV